MHSILLGQQSHYSEDYDPALLHAIPRKNYRQSVHSSCPTVSQGFDRWVCYEFSALLASGKPIHRILVLTVPACSKNIVESKSLKLYLNSWNQEQVSCEDSLRNAIRKDLAKLLDDDITVTLHQISAHALAALDIPLQSTLAGGAVHLSFDDAICLDALEVECNEYEPNRKVLKLIDKNPVAVFYSHLLRSNCPVTNQPDWATIVVAYDNTQSDAQIAGLCPEHLLRYIVSFRKHNGFHEQTVEQIYSDLKDLGLKKLAVCALYTRRGGIDISPWRTTGDIKITVPRFNCL